MWPIYEGANVTGWDLLSWVRPPAERYVYAHGRDPWGREWMVPGDVWVAAHPEDEAVWTMLMARAEQVEQDEIERERANVERWKAILEQEGTDEFWRQLDDFAGDLWDRAGEVVQVGIGIGTIIITTVVLVGLWSVFRR